MRMEQANGFLMKPKIDFAFKELMVNNQVRLGFVAAVLGVDPSEIKETKLLNTELRREHGDEKQGILDVHVLMNDDTEIDIEINLVLLTYWADRSLFYVAKMLAAGLHPGERYDKLRKCIGISVLDFKLFRDSEEYYSCFHLWEDTRHTKYTDKLEFHVIELPKLPELTKERIESCDDPRELWAEFIRAERKEDFEMIANRDPYISKAYDQLQIISQDTQLRYEYLAREKAIRDHLQYEWEAEQRVLEALENGRKEGEAKGEVRGETRGTIITYKEMGLDRGAAVSRLVKRYSLSYEGAAQKVEQYWNS